MLEGIDVSNNNGRIDWASVRAAGKRFALIKSSEATYFEDRFFLPNWEGCRQNNILPGAYHFCRPSQSSAEDEANFFINLMGGPTFSKGDIVALDLEDGGGDLFDWVYEWLQRVEEGVQVKPILYTNLDYIYNHGLARPEMADYGLWLASPGTGYPNPPDPWPVVAIHQYDWHGRVPGIPTEVDLNHFAGTITQLRKYGAR